MCDTYVSLWGKHLYDTYGKYVYSIWLTYEATAVITVMENKIKSKLLTNSDFLPFDL